ncbi:SusC/RagA family TonB-linked outer membrane protein [Balneolales bacterium ANBcel1]|nr:SusC/RagA family TonB-linked outer membrane protein [Balneolales bacterium ANBcel1]
MAGIDTVKSMISGLVIIVLLAGQAFSQHQVRGTVTDDAGMESPGVNIIVKGTNIGTTTDGMGEFRLTAPAATDTLIFSFIGFERLEVPIDEQEVLNVTMQRIAIMGEEVVMVGYGTQSRRELTGSITSVQTETMNTVARTSFNQMLQGQAPGLNMQTRSAQPGGGVSVNIRGAISPGGSNQPLYVIDGVPVTEYSSTVPSLFDEGDSGGVLGFYGGIDRDPLSYLNPSDIESITVMKDASAAAIYGSAAANGVVLITTKSGQAGDIQVNYRGSMTTQRAHDYLPLLNERQFMEQQDRLAHEFYRYENNLQPYGPGDPASSGYSPLFSQGEIAAAGIGTNWPDLLMRNGTIQEHNISISGGTDQTRVFGSFNFQDNEAILKNSTFSRYAGRLNVDQQLSRFVDLNIRSTVSRIDGNNPATGASIGGPGSSNMIQAAVSFAPTFDVYDESGAYSRTYNSLIMNPVSFFDMTDESQTTNIFVAPKLEVQFHENLQGTLRGQYDTEKTVRSFYLPRTSNHSRLSEGMGQKTEATRDNMSVEGFFTWNRRMENSAINVVAGSGLYRAEGQGFGVVGIGFFTDAFRENNLAIAEDSERTEMFSWRNERTKLSQFMRVNYTLYDRYVFSGVVRRDGSSVFAEDNKWGIFPGISAAWIISDEAFLRDVDQISELKIRLGYGQAGNESVLSGNTLQLYGPGFSYMIGNVNRNGVTLTQIANPNLAWETVTTINAGIDFGFFRNRLRGAVDLYQKTASDLLDFNIMPFNNPVGRIADNVGSTRSRGIELTLRTLNLSDRSFQWSTDFNISYYESYWRERNPQVPLPSYVGERDPFGAIYGWETAGIITSEEEIPDHMPNANPGNLIFVDQNGDGILDSDDVVKIGNGIPKWSVGLGNDFSYGNFNVRVFVYGNLGFDRYNNLAPNIGNLRLTGAPLNTTTLAKDVWSSDHPQGTRPGVAPNPYSGDNPEGTDFDLEDASFIRIGDISLGYSIPQRWLMATGLNMRSAEIFVNMQDLGVFTSYSGYDPELTEVNPYPKSYSLTMGVELRF